MRTTVMISEARARLFELVEQVVGRYDEVVLIEHRDLEERAALISEEHLRFLEVSLEQMRKRFTKPFKLKGSIKTDLTAEELGAALDEIKQDAARRAEEKMQKLDE